MISSKLTRVAHRAPSAASVASTSTSSAAHRTAPCIAGRRCHQRRQSSSKASCPPDSSPSGGKPAPAAKTSAAAAPSSDAASSKTPISASRVQQRGGGKRVSRNKRLRETDLQAEDKFAGLPAVPATQHLHPNDISVSSFFSLHRPLSISTTFPPPSTAQAFDSIFEVRHQSDPWENGNSAERQPEDVIYTLHNALESLESGISNNADDAMRWEVVQDGQSSTDGVKHLDGAPRIKTLDELVAQFKPFRVPPPPQPFPSDAKSPSSGAKRAAKDAKSQRQPQQKSYTTTIIVTESTNVDGRRTWTASSSPIVRIPGPDEQAATEAPQAQRSVARFPFRERMRQRQQEYALRHTEKMHSPSAGVRTRIRQPPVTKRSKMLLISVKRQRKLKMKKHKYKKLMRRTRNLRRRQDRA